MISKTLLATCLCFLVILTAIGAYGYVTVIDLSNQVNSLKDTVSSLEEERTALQNNISALESQVENLQSVINDMNSTCNTRTFKFFWEGSIAEYFNTTRFWMNITLERVTLLGPPGIYTRINITVEANDLREDWWDSYLGISSELTGTFRYLVGSDYKWQGCLGDYNSCGQRFIDILAFHLTPSDHTFQYDPDFGVTYVVLSYYLEGLPTELPNVIHVEYSHTVVVEFCFGEELIT